jgi:hypothetical protein
MEFPLVEVVWDDAALNAAAVAHTTEGDVEEFGKLMECRDVGYLVEIDKKAIKLAISITEEDNQFRSANIIPRKWTREIILLERPT